MSESPKVRPLRRQRAANPDPLRVDVPPKPVIQLADADWNGVVRSAAEHLRGRVYMRDQVPMMLTTAADVGRDADTDDVELRGVRYERNTALLVTATPGLLAHQLDGDVTFERFMRREKEWVPTRCPDALAKRLVDAATRLGFRSCVGIAHTPLFIDGDVVCARGWHADTRLFIDSPALTEIPPRPTRADAERAVETLLWPFRGYTTVKAAALLAGSLTAALRASLPTAPGLLIDGNTQGVGKGKIARSWSALATGRTPAVCTEGHHEEETEKRITAVFLSGAPAALFDNIQRHFASSTLESALTEGTATIRVFGKLENLKVPTRALVLLTSNNGSFRRDMLRRTLPVRIVVASETPEARPFDFCPVEETQTNRHHMLAAAFTIARAWWLVREHPDNRHHHKALGSFELWAELVGGAVSWLLGSNPVDLIAERKAADPYVAAERAVINALAAKYGDQAWRAADAAAHIDAALWGAVLPSRRGDDKATAKAVGHWLRVRRDRVFGQWQLSAETDRNGVNEWQLKVVG